MVNVKILRVTVLSVVFAALFAGHAFSQSKIIAVVNNEVITRKDLDDFVNFMRVQLSREYDQKKLDNKIQEMKSDLLDRLIEDRLILQEAKKNNVKVEESRVKARLDEIKKGYPSEADFNSALAKQGLVIADLEARMRDQLLMRAIIETKVRSAVVVNPGEITDFYYKNIVEFRVPEQREFESIAIEGEALAGEVYDKLKAGLSLIDLSIQYSLKISKLTAAAGGELRKDIEQSVFGLGEGQFSQPIKIDDSYYIFKLDAITPSKERSFSDVQNNIYNYIFEQKLQEQLVNWLEGLKKHSYIKITKD